mmetsp:Transcript_21201/g.42458  ORF Transcript_21201/g.42458 Transcript_21201/m.42458 type:complete len:256 (+) Transcript_21201:164-931(+)
MTSCVLTISWPMVLRAFSRLTLAFFSSSSRSILFFSRICFSRSTFAAFSSSVRILAASVDSSKSLSLCPVLLACSTAPDSSIPSSSGLFAIHSTAPATDLTRHLARTCTARSRTTPMSTSAARTAGSTTAGAPSSVMTASSAGATVAAAAAGGAAPSRESRSARTSPPFAVADAAPPFPPSASPPSRTAQCSFTMASSRARSPPTVRAASAPPTNRMNVGNPRTPAPAHHSFAPSMCSYRIPHATRVVFIVANCS